MNSYPLPVDRVNAGYIALLGFYQRFPKGNNIDYMQSYFISIITTNSVWKDREIPGGSSLPQDKESILNEIFEYHQTSEKLFNSDENKIINQLKERDLLGEKFMMHQREKYE